MTTFEDAMRAQITARPRSGARGRRVLAVLDARPSKARTRRIARLERHAAAVVGAEVGAIDWGAIDWKKLFDQILEILLKILPLLM